MSEGQESELIDTSIDALSEVANAEGTLPDSRLGLSDEYGRWNSVLTEFCLLSAQANSAVFLSVTPRLLAKALDDIENVVLTPEDAREDFRQAVSEMYRDAILGRNNGIGALSTVTSDGIPQSVAFLGLSVLAAYDQTRGDEPMGRLRYYEPLSDLLKCEMVGSYPKGFDPQQFDDLWENLGLWLLEKSGGFLALPPQTGQHTAYPRHHALLRKVDVEKLPALFEARGFEPGSHSVSPRRLALALGGFTRLTHDAQQALADARRDGVITQVEAELESWDGSVTDSRGVLKASIQVLLYFRGDRPVLHYIPSRPKAFPEVFESGDVCLEAGDGQYYEPIDLHPSEGEALRSGFEWNCGRLALRRPACRVIALSQAKELSGFISQAGLPRGVRSAVMCIDELQGDVTSYLARITGRQYRPYEDSAVPEGWVLYEDVVPLSAAPPSVGLEVLEVSDAVTIDFVGGLRLDRSRTWLVGAPPKVLVSGPRDVIVDIDRERCGVVEGQVTAPSLSLVGSHTIRAGRLSRTVAVAEARVNWETCSLLVTDELTEFSLVPVPPGRWVLIGQRPTQALHLAPLTRATAIRCPFAPVWAVDPRNDRGRRRVICLVEDPPSAELMRTVVNTQLWSSSVRTACVHHPAFEWLRPNPVPKLDLKQVWKTYRDVAASLRRQGRIRSSGQ